MRLITSSKGQALVLLLLTMLAGLLTGTVQADAALPVALGAVVAYMLTTAAEDIAAKSGQGTAFSNLMKALGQLAQPAVQESLKRFAVGTRPADDNSATTQTPGGG